MTKRLLLILSMTFVLFIVGCSNDSSGEAGNDKDADSNSEAVNEVTVWAWDPNFNIKALEIAEEIYQKDHPDFKLNIIENTHEDIVQKMNTTLSSGTTKGLPNIVLIEDTRSQVTLNSYPDAFYEMTDHFDSSKFADYKLGATQMDGKDYGLPFDSGVTALYVRTDYLAEAGYTVEDLQNITWDEYVEIGKDVNEATGKYMISLEPNDLGIVRAMMHSADSWFIDEDGETPYIEDNEALKRAFEYYKEMLDLGIARTHSDFAERISLFNDGEVASVFDGNWIGASIKQEESQSGDWAVVPTPKLEGLPNAVNASNLGGSSWYVMDVDGSELAADFLAETFGNDVELYQSMINEMGALGTYLPAAEGDAYQLEDEYFGGEKVYANLADWVEKVPKINYGDNMQMIDDIITNEMQNYLNGTDLADVLKSAQQQAEALN